MYRRCLFVFSAFVIINSCQMLPMDRKRPAGDRVAEFERPSKRSKVDLPPLHAAIRDNNIDLIDQLLKDNASEYINQVNFRGETPLLYALRYGWLKKEKTFVVDKLLRYGADIDVEDHFELSPAKFLSTSSAENVRMIAICIKHGRDMSERPGFTMAKNYLTKMTLATMLLPRCNSRSPAESLTVFDVQRIAQYFNA